MEFICFLIVVIGLFSVIFTMGFLTSYDAPHVLWTLLGWIPCLILAIWLIISTTQPNRISCELNCKIMSRVTDLKTKEQFITWQDNKGQICELSVTNHFRCILDEQIHTIDVKTYEQGPYFGLMWKIPSEYTVIIKK